MGNKYTIVSENLATDAVATLTPETLGSCDEICCMSLTELRDFWWAYCYSLISRLPFNVRQRNEHSIRELTVEALDLLMANDATAQEFMQNRIEPRLGHVPLTRFGLKHLLPALANKIHPDLCIEIKALVWERYGPNQR